MPQVRTNVETTTHLLEGESVAAKKARFESAATQKADAVSPVKHEVKKRSAVAATVERGAIQPAAGQREASPDFKAKLALIQAANPVAGLKKGASPVKKTAAEEVETVEAEEKQVALPKKEVLAAPKSLKDNAALNANREKFAELFKPKTTPPTAVVSKEKVEELAQAPKVGILRSMYNRAASFIARILSFLKGCVTCQCFGKKSDTKEAVIPPAPLLPQEPTTTEKPVIPPPPPPPPPPFLKAK